MKRSISVAILFLFGFVLFTACNSGANTVSSQQPASSSPSTSQAASQPVQEELPPYQLIPITQEKYEGEDSYIEFATLPQTDTETLVCDYYYGWVIEEGPAIAALWMPGAAAPSPLSSVAVSVIDIVEWIKVQKVEQMEAADVAKLDVLKLWHEQYGGETTYSEYVDAVMEAGCQVVVVDFEFKYKEGQGAQIEDGEHTEYWLLVPDEDGNLKLFDCTRFYSQFTPPADETLAPDPLVVGE